MRRDAEARDGECGLHSPRFPSRGFPPEHPRQAAICPPDFPDWSVSSRLPFAGRTSSIPHFAWRIACAVATIVSAMTLFLTRKCAYVLCIRACHGMNNLRKDNFRRPIRGWFIEGGGDDQTVRCTGPGSGGASLHAGF